MIKVVVVGLGNLGKYALDAINATNDIECIGIIRRTESLGKNPEELRGLKDYDCIDKLVADKGKPDVAIICYPSRDVLKVASTFMRKCINTVDSFDIHTDITTNVQELQKVADETGKTAIVAAGWDPGTDSAFRAYFEAMAPTGATFTNFGRGRSMGHSVAVRNIKGVKDATSITIPMGCGQHSRLVYVLLENGESIEKVTERIKNDSYFCNDPLQVVELKTAREIELVADSSHGVLMERIGGAGSVSNQHFKFDMRINNPALTSQVMVSCARASMRLSKGAYTMIDIPPVHLLEGERFYNIKRLV